MRHSQCLACDPWVRGQAGSGGKSLFLQPWWTAGGGFLKPWGLPVSLCSSPSSEAQPSLGTAWCWAAPGTGPAACFLGERLGRGRAALLTSRALSSNDSAELLTLGIYGNRAPKRHRRRVNTAGGGWLCQQYRIRSLTWNRLRAAAGAVRLWVGARPPASPASPAPPGARGTWSRPPRPRDTLIHRQVRRPSHSAEEWARAWGPPGPLPQLPAF